MLADEADAARRRESFGDAARNLGLTISAADLLCRGNGENDSQGNYDYDAHAQVHVGGADPLESQGYASAVKKNPFSS
jgi:hypothetical protein